MSPKAAKSKNLIATFDYLRKSRKDRKHGHDDGEKYEEKSIADQRRELDGLHFPQEIAQAGFDGYDVVNSFADVGVPGWKMGPKRPGFEQMFHAIKAHPAKHKAIRVDNMDRFSRANVDDTADIIRELKRAGVKWIVSRMNGVFHIGHGGNDLVEYMKVAFVCHASHEYCRNLSFRNTRARGNAAVKAKRTGGAAPYGLSHVQEKNERGELRNRSLKHGDPAKAKIVRQIFQWFAHDKRSLNWIAGELNRRKVPGPRGPQWYTMSVKVILTCPAYRGDFVFNKVSTGQFFRIDENKKVVEVAEEERSRLRKNGDDQVFKREGVYRPLVPPALFDKATRRLNGIAKDRSRRERQDRYPLTGVLYCKCGALMYGVTTNKKRGGGTVVYRCSAPGATGKCQQWQVREDFILPFVMTTLRDGVVEVMKRLTQPQEVSHDPARAAADQRKQLQRERDRLAAQISHAEDGLFDLTDHESRQSLDRKITAKRQELAAIDAQLAIEENETATQKDSEAKALFAWWDAFQKTACHVPVSWENIGQMSKLGIPFNVDPASIDPECDRFPPGPPELLIDPVNLNLALREIGVRVDLRWQTVQNGKRVRHDLDTRHIRFRLAQKQDRPRQYTAASSVGRCCRGSPTARERTDRPAGPQAANAR